MADMSDNGGSDDGGAATIHRPAFERVRDYVNALPDDDEAARDVKAALEELMDEPKLGKKVSKGGTCRVLSQQNLCLVRHRASGISGLCRVYNWWNNISQNTSQRFRWLIRHPPKQANEFGGLSGLLDEIRQNKPENLAAYLAPICGYFYLIFDKNSHTIFTTILHYLLHKS